MATPSQTPEANAFADQSPSEFVNREHVGEVQEHHDKSLKDEVMPIKPVRLQSQAVAGQDKAASNEKSYHDENKLETDPLIAKERLTLFINKQPKTLDGYAQITDASVSAYLSQMQALKQPIENTGKVNLHLDIKEDLIGLDDLLDQISIHQFRVKRITVNDSNFVSYTRLLKGLRTPFLDAHEVNIDVHVDEELLKVQELMTQIKRNNFVVSELRLRDSKIDDSNVRDYIILLRSLPPLLKGADQTSFDIQITEELTDASELLDTICSLQLKVNSILMNGRNFKYYAKYFKSVKTSMKHSSKVNTDICIDEDMIAMRDLMTSLKKNRFNVRTLQVKDSEIDATNVSEYISMFNSFPPLLKDANQTNIAISLKGGLAGASELLQLISDLQFKVQRIFVNDNNCKGYYSMLRALTTPLRNPHDVKFDLRIYARRATIIKLVTEIQRENFKVNRVLITDRNIFSYTLLLKALPTPLRYAHDVKIDICIGKGVLTISKLVKEMKAKHFLVRKLCIREIKINDDNLSQYREMLCSLPMLQEGAYDKVINVRLRKEASDICQLLKAISINRFALRLELHHDFRNPKRQSTLEEVLTDVFERCDVLRYMGPAVPNIGLRDTITHLSVSIADARMLTNLQSCLPSMKKLEVLKLCVKEGIDSRDIQPLPVPLAKTPYLYLVDISTASEVRHACDIVKRFQPHGGFHDIFFPRANMASEVLRDLIAGLQGIKLTVAVVLPESCTPSPQEVSFLNDTVKADSSFLIKWFGEGHMWYYSSTESSSFIEGLTCRGAWPVCLFRGQLSSHLLSRNMLWNQRLY